MRSDKSFLLAGVCTLLVAATAFKLEPMGSFINWFLRIVFESRDVHLLSCHILFSQRIRLAPVCRPWIAVSVSIPLALAVTWSLYSA